MGSPDNRESIRHTPGPWEYVEDVCGSRVVADGHGFSAPYRLDPGSGLDPRQCADNRLIAAAPAMAEALLAIARADCNCDRGYPGSCGCGERARERADDALELAGLCRDCSGTGVNKIRVRGGDIDERNCHCPVGQARWAKQEAASNG